MTETIDKIKAFVMANKKIVAIAGGAILLLILIIAIIAGAGGSSKDYQKVAYKYYTAYYKDQSAKKVVKCYDQKLLKALLENADESESEFTEKLQESIDDYKDELEDEEVKKSGIHIDKKSIKKDGTVSNDDMLDDLNDILKDNGYKGKKVTKIIRVKLKIEIDGMEDPTAYVYLAQVGKKLVAIPYSFI